jgi:hypothetical protein
MATKAQKANLAAAQALLKALDQYETPGEKAIAASDIAWMATDQMISPDDLLDQGIDSAVEYLQALAELSEQSEGVEDLMPDLESRHSDLAKRWRSIRAKAIKSIL